MDSLAQCAKKVKLMYYAKALCNGARPGMFGADAATPPAALGTGPAPSASSFIPALAPSASSSAPAAASSLEAQYQATTTPTPIHPGLTGSHVDEFGNAHPVVAGGIRYVAPAGLAYWGWAAAHPVALGIGGVWLGLNVLGKIISVVKK